MFLRACAITALCAIAMLCGGYADAMSPGNSVSESELGVILLAHGSGNEWNTAVADMFAKTEGTYKRELVFGMGNARDIQKSVDRLQTSGVRAIIVIPLFLSSHSEMYRHLEYILGLREEPDVLFWFLMSRHTETDSGGGHGEHGLSSSFFERVRFSVPYRVASPVGFNSVIAEILSERLRGFVAADTSVFLLSHGPITAEDDTKWLADLLQYEKYLAFERYLSGEFPDTRFIGMTWRDDAPPFIRDRAIQKIQDAVRREVVEGRRVVILPFLLASGGREAEIKIMLRNCGTCVLIPRMLLPHPAAWRYLRKKIDDERVQIDFLR